MEKSFINARNAAEITLNKVPAYESLNAPTEEMGDTLFAQKTRELWDKFAVHGTFSYDKATGQRHLQSATDLDGRTAIELLKMAGIDTSDIIFVKPGDVAQGRINLDTGNQLGVTYDKESDTAIIDHHTSDGKVITSAAQVMYETLLDLKMINRTDALDKVIDFVTQMDNKLIPATEFLKSGKTIIGIQRHLDFPKLLQFFTDHDSPFDELTPEDFAKYGLREPAERQQKIVDASMEKLSAMENEGKVIKTDYGSIVINIDNELPVGSSAAYVRHDGIINFTPEKSFAVTLKDREFDERRLKDHLGEKFQGKVIRGKMWIYNDIDPLKMTIEDIITALK